MGNAIYSRCYAETDEKSRIIFLGLGDAGKTSILLKLKLGEAIDSVPTFSSDVERVDYKNEEFYMWDPVGREKMRAMYKFFYMNTDGLVFVVDSNDKARLEDAMKELEERINIGEEVLEDVPVLVLANKQDLPGAMTPSSIGAHIVEKGYLRKQPWCVFGASAISTDDQYQLYEGMDWLHNQVTRRRKQKWFDKHVGKSSKATKRSVKKVKETDANDISDQDKDISKVTYLTDLARALKKLVKK